MTKTATAIGALLLLTFPYAAPRADTVSWIPGVYDEQAYYGGPTVDTLTVANTGSYTDFTLQGAQNLSFSIPNSFQPLVIPNPAPIYGYDLIIPSAALASESWPAAQYPYTEFYSQSDGGGIVIATVPGGNVSNGGGDLAYTWSSSSRTHYTVTPSGNPVEYALPESAAGALNLTAYDHNSTRQNCCGTHQSYPSDKWGQNIEFDGPDESAAGVIDNIVPNVGVSAWTRGAGSDSGVYAVANASLTYYVKFLGKEPRVPVEVSGASLYDPECLQFGQ